MVSISNNVNNNKSDSIKSKAVSAGASLTGAGIGLAIPYTTIKDAFTLQTPIGVESARKFMQKLMPEVDTFETTAKNVKAIMEETGLTAKGVKFSPVDKSTEGLKTLDGIIEANTKTNSNNKLINKIRQVYRQTFSEGTNAAYFPGTKNVVVNKESLYSSVYHELGHAKNANGSFATKALQKARNITPFGVSLIAPVVLAVGLLHKVDKTKPQEEKGKLEKTLDFVSNNAGKLTLASYAPMLAEEGLASYNGIKMAKKYLSPDQLGKLKGSYLKAWGTYAATAGLIAGGVALGIKVANVIKDKMAPKQTQTA